jgi:hypothetical protein
MVRRIIQLFQSAEAEKGLVIIVIIKLSLHLFILSAWLAKLVQITDTRAISYAGDYQLITLISLFSLFSLIQIIDASYVLKTMKTNQAALKMNGIPGLFLKLFFFPLSPGWILGVLILIIIAVIVCDAISLFGSIIG